MRGRLNQLRDLVQYYQSSSEFIHGVEDPVDDDEDSAQPTSGNYRYVVPNNPVTVSL